MQNKSYAEKLKDPRWQKKRLEILNRDNWSCRRCGDKENTLHVHHNYYDNELEPFDYTDSSLITLCENCHIEEAECMKEVEKYFINFFKAEGYLSSELDNVTVLLDTIKCDSGVPIMDILKILNKREGIEYLHSKYFPK